MTLNRRGFAKSLASVVGAFAAGAKSSATPAPRQPDGLGVTVDEKQLTFVEAMTEGAPGVTQRRPDGSLTHR